MMKERGYVGMKEKNRENPFAGMTREEIIQEAKRQILRSAVLALAALAVIGVACYAWFVNSGVVTAITGQVTMSTDGFELASEGTVGIFDNVYFDSSVPDGSFLEEMITWTRGNRVVRWRMNQTSNLSNYDTKKNGIHPNSAGTLKFYVIPQSDGALTLNCHVNLNPLKLNSEGKYVSCGVNSTEAKLMRGHLMFAYSYEGEAGTVSGLIPVNTSAFTVSLPEVRADRKYEVTLTWFWPYVLREAMNRQPYGDTITGWVENDALWDYFYYDGGRTVSVSQTPFRGLSNFYNMADQYIGDHVNAVIVELEAEQA